MKQKLHLKGRLTTLALCAALLVSLLSPAAYAAGGNGSAVTAISTVATGEGLSERVTQVTLDFGTSEADKTYQYRKAGATDWAGSVTVNSSGLAIINTSALELHYGNSLEVKADGGETVTVKVLDNALRNGGFEINTVGNASYVATLKADEGIYAWRTTATDANMEVGKHSTYTGSATAEGTYCAELNAHERASLYQEVFTPNAGDVFAWSLMHAGVSTTDTMALVIGPAVDDYSKEGNNKENRDFFQRVVEKGGLSSESTAGLHVVTLDDGSSYNVWIISDEEDVWKTYTGTYTIPANQPETVFGFTSLYDVPGSGNLLDGIAFSRTPVEASGAVDENGNGSVIVDEIKNDASYTLKNADGTPITGLKAYDGNGNEITPVDGKYSTTNGPITFEVPAGKQYIVEETFGYGTVETTEAVVPAIGGNAWGELDEANNEASVAIEKADPNLQYAIIDPETGDIKGGWSDGDETSVTFDGLEPGKEYTVVSWPKGQSGAPESGDDLKEFGELLGVVVRTPDSNQPGKPELNDGGIKVDVEREGDGAATITVTRPADDDTQYKLYDPETGESILPDKFDGDKIIFTGVDPSKDYQLIPSEPYKEIPGNADQTGGSKDGAMPLPSKDSGVNIPAADDDVLAEDISAASDGDGKVSVTFPTKDGNTYFVVNDKGEIVSEVTGDGEIATVDGLEPGDYRVVTVPTEDVTDDNKSELVANNTGAHFAVADPVPVGSENAAGGDYIDRTTSGSTETITIADAEDGFSYALVDADGNYYTTSGQPITGDTDPWQAGKGDGSDITFFGLDPNKEYTVLKIPTGADGAVPVGTDVGTRGGAVDASDVSAEYVSDGTVTVTVDDPKADHTYAVTDSTGKVVAVNPTENADGSLSFPGLKPGIEYTVVEIAPEDIEAHGEPKLNDDLSTGDYAQNFEDGVEISAMPSLGDGISVGQDSANDGKAQIVVEPADEELKYVLVDKETGKVVSVKPAENGKVVFDGLDPSTEYEIYTIPKTESDPSGAFPGGDDSIGDPATVTTPTGDELDAAGAASDAVIKEHDKITIPAEAVEDGMDYVLIAPDGSIIEGEKDADGNIVFDDLTPNTDYTLAVRPSGSGEPANLVTAGTVHTPNEPTNVPATVIVSSVQNGTVSVSPSVPAAGDKVTITTKPNAGYELGSITVKDKDGNTLTLTNIGGGRFTYTQPVNGPVTVFVTFVKTGESAVADPSVTGVADLLETDDHISFMNGYPDGSFNPNGNITRAEAAQIFFNLLRDKDVEISGSFSDVSANQWYYDAVMTLSEMGIINGVGGDSYAPGRSITRAEFVTIAMRFANAVETGSSFTDVPGGYWAYGYISGATYYGWINGYEDGSFRPNAPITRAEAAAVVNRMLNRAGDAEYIDANLSSLTTFPDVTRAHWAYYNVLEATNAHDYERSDKGVESWEPKK